MPTKTGSLRLIGVGKHYGAVEALSDVSFDVAPGEFVTLLGPSGCGKSTLLRMIAGLETITSGEMEMDGRAIGQVHPRDRDIAMVFQNYALYPHMSVAQNLAYPLKLRGVAKPQRRLKVEAVAGMLELEPLLERKPAALSGGQRQRVAMGRALVREPSLFLMDEPLSNLDARLRMQMRIEIAALQRRLGITTIYVTHDQVEAMTMADRIVVMSAGRIQQIGAPYEIYLRPANLFVAAFLGSPAMNLVSGDGPLGDALARRLGAARGGVTVGIRPEDVAFAGDGTAGPGTRLDGRLFALEALGPEALCHVRPAGGGAPVVVRRPGNPQTLLDTDVSLVLPDDALHLFDTKTGRRLDGTPEGPRVPGTPHATGG